MAPVVERRARSGSRSTPKCKDLTLLREVTYHAPVLRKTLSCSRLATRRGTACPLGVHYWDEEFTSEAGCGRGLTMRLGFAARPEGICARRHQNAARLAVGSRP